jgi:TrmH family RNA methyltransferase
MLSRNQAKHIHSLKLPKFRQEHGQFVAEGLKLAEELLESNYKISEVFALAPWLEKHESALIRKGIRFFEVDEIELGKISQLVTPNEVLMLVEIPDEPGDELLLPDLTLFLDRIQDPGNLGTIIRTADWFGIGLVVCSSGCADIYNPKVIQSTMGSITRVKVVERNGNEFLSGQAGKAVVFGAVAGGKNVYGADLRFPAVVVIGNESKGISNDLLPLIGEQIGIPPFSGKAESLNAAVATAVICSEFRRRQSAVSSRKELNNRAT